MRFLNERGREPTANYFKSNVYIVGTTDRRITCMGSRQSYQQKMSRNKSVIRSTSTGSYPYPRTHTTLMVIPSTRPPLTPTHSVASTSSTSSSSLKMFAGTRRRPPLNRACPPIPESKSNESIMSHASRISEKQRVSTSEDQVQSDLVIENRSVVDSLNRLDLNSNLSRPLKSKAKKMPSSTPRSPLMSVAHSVKSKLTKITNIGRNSLSERNPATSTPNIKTSQSFSGIRQPKSVPRRIDQNANRVIKSSSMDVAEASTSKCIIPQNPTPLVDDKIEEISETGLVPNTELAPPKPMEHVCVKLEEDVLVVTKEFDAKYPGQKRSASPDAVTDTHEILDSKHVTQVAHSTEVFPPEPTLFDANANPKSESQDRLILNHKTLVIAEKPAVEIEEEKIEYTRLETVKFSEPEIKSRIEEDPPRETKFIMQVKTPEALRRHHTFTIRDKSPEQIEMVKSRSFAHCRKPSEKIEVRQTSEAPSDRFILTVRTPEALRKHRTLRIGAKEKEEEEVRNLEKVVMKKLRRAESEPRRKVEAEPKYVIIMKTPEALRRHHTFAIGDRPKSPDYPYIEEGETTEPIATIGPPAERRKKEEARERKRKEWEEYEKPPKEKYVLHTTTTPIAIRKFHTFVVEPKTQPVVSGSVSADHVTTHKKHNYLRRLQFELFRGRSSERKASKRQKSLDERKPESAQKYVLSTTTPVMMRKYQTFAIVDQKSDSNLEAIEASYSPIRTADFYSITATTPIAKRKGAGSPESRHLFVMGGRRSVTPREQLKLDTGSQSDRAEVMEDAKSSMSGDLTTPEEEIPMDTNPTPTIVDRPIVSRRIGDATSPIEEESEGGMSSIRDERAAPVFTPPSPPAIPLMLPKSTSTSSESSATRRKPTELPIRSGVDPVRNVEEVKSKPRTKSSQIATKSLRNAGKMLTPSFLRKDRKNKKSSYPKTTSTGREHISEKLDRKAPLAEGESSVVANSPLVENLPITFEKWVAKSPRPALKYQEPIVEEGLDANANFGDFDHPPLHSANRARHDHTGLIDDDILDQPMLVGDTFSQHSSSIDGLSQHHSTTTTTHPKTTMMSESIISIDRSIAHDTLRSRGGTTATNFSGDPNLSRQIDVGLSEVEDIKTQLQRLNKLVNEMGVGGWEEEIIRLRRENAQLRQEIAEKDATIVALRAQTVLS